LLDYELVYTKRKSIALIVQPDGGVVIRAPFGTRQKVIDDFFASKQRWVEGKLRDLEGRRELLPVRQYVSGGKVHYEGEEVLQREYRLACERFGLDVEDAPSLRIRDMKSRWGSYSSKTYTVCLNARLIRAPVAAVRMICIHELIHIKIDGHGKDFYAAMDRYQDPGWREVKRNLDLNYR